MSFVRNHEFQIKVYKEFGKEIELALGVKHRCNSSPNVLDPIIKTKTQTFDT